jgi:hypothetical protein
VPFTKQQITDLLARATLVKSSANVLSSAIAKKVLASQTIKAVKVELQNGESFELDDYSIVASEITNKVGTLETTVQKFAGDLDALLK